MCKVTEHPWNDEQKEDDTDAAAAVTACVVHGSFDPYTHITTDSATGSCHLEFLPLFDSCDVDVDGSTSGVFGMKAEIDNSRNTENHNDDNSGMLLHFSHNGGAKYYNVDDPRETVPLHGVIPAHRKLQSTCGDICETSTGSYKESKDYCYWCYVGETCAFQDSQTGFCYNKKNVGEYCWNSQNQCPPKCYNGAWQGMAPKKDGTCGEPCSKSSAGGNQYTINEQWNSGNYVSKVFGGFVYGTVTSVYNPQFFFCFTDTDGNYCWYPTNHLPYGDWKGAGGRNYNDCGGKCTKFADNNEHNGIN